MAYFDDHDLDVSVTTTISEMGGEVGDPELRECVLTSMRRIIDGVDRSGLWLGYSTYTNEPARQFGLDFAAWQMSHLPITESDLVDYLFKPISARGLSKSKEKSSVPVVQKQNSGLEI